MAIGRIVQQIRTIMPKATVLVAIARERRCDQRYVQSAIPLNIMSEEPMMLGDEFWVEETLETLATPSLFATVLQDEGKYVVAREMQECALRGRQNILRSEHPAILNNIYNLATILHRLVANVLRTRDMFEEAEKLQSDALERRKRVLGMNHPETSRSVRDIANMDRLAGRLKESAQRFDRAFDGFRRVLGDSHQLREIMVGSLIG